jgi:nitrate/TMAO reductase-like tetraheme cytochrome c subunit
VGEHWATAGATTIEHRGASVFSMHPVMSAIALACAGIAAALLLWFLFSKPQLTGQVKVLLLLGFGVFPIGAAATGNLAGFEHTKNRPFCGSCHVMTPYRLDSEDPLSKSLAAAHARNEEFGPNNCYQCHREYGQFSTVLTKIGGMRHVYHYYTHYKDVDVDTAIHEIELYKPMANASCMTCHSTEVSSWLNVADHRSSLEPVRAGKLSCVSEGCHGPAHPFSKPKRPPAGAAL